MTGRRPTRFQHRKVAEPVDTGFGWCWGSPEPNSWFSSGYGFGCGFGGDSIGSGAGPGTTNSTPEGWSQQVLPRHYLDPEDP